MKPDVSRKQSISQQWMVGITVFCLIGLGACGTILINRIITSRPVDGSIVLMLIVFGLATVGNFIELVQTEFTPESD